MGQGPFLTDWCDGAASKDQIALDKTDNLAALSTHVSAPLVLDDEWMLRDCSGLASWLLFDGKQHSCTLYKQVDDHL